MADLAVSEALRAYVKLLRASRAIVARVEPHLIAAGLTVTQFGVLEAILHKGPLTQRELGLKVLTSAGNMTDVIDKLHARGFVRRVRRQEDRRSVRVELTEAGRTLITELFPRHAADIATAMSGLTAAELRTLGELLRKVGMAAARRTIPLADRSVAANLTCDRSMANE
jgi:MarR family 2-MHQ and catechol resistance regulon transcriptional repressor